MWQVTVRRGGSFESTGIRLDGSCDRCRISSTDRARLRARPEVDRIAGADRCRIISADRARLRALLGIDPGTECDRCRVASADRARLRALPGIDPGTERDRCRITSADRAQLRALPGIDPVLESGPRLLPVAGSRSELVEWLWCEGLLYPLFG